MFADSKEIAEILFAASNNSVNHGVEIYLDTPEPNKGAVDLAESNNMNKVFETTRIYNKEEPKIDLTRIYGVTTFELG